MASVSAALLSRLCEQEQTLLVDRYASLVSPTTREYEFADTKDELAGAIDHWPALSLWNQAYLTDQLQDKEVGMTTTTCSIIIAVSVLLDTAVYLCIRCTDKDMCR